MTRARSRGDSVSKAEGPAEGRKDRPSYRIQGRKDKMIPRSSLDSFKGGGTQETQRRKGQLVWGKESACFLGYSGVSGDSEGTSTEVAMRVRHEGHGGWYQEGALGIKGSGGHKHSPNNERLNQVQWGGTHSIKGETAHATSDARIQQLRASGPLGTAVFFTLNGRATESRSETGRCEGLAGGNETFREPSGRTEEETEQGTVLQSGPKSGQLTMRVRSGYTGAQGLWGQGGFFFPTLRTL